MVSPAKLVRVDHELMGFGGTCSMKVRVCLSQDIQGCLLKELETRFFFYLCSVGSVGKLLGNPLLNGLYKGSICCSTSDPFPLLKV